jgi:adenylyltransferase/sulfurtransferase
MEAVKHLVGIGEVLAGRLLVIEGAVPEFEVVEIERNPACGACGDL